LVEISYIKAKEKQGEDAAGKGKATSFGCNPKIHESIIYEKSKRISLLDMPIDGYS